jgi:hypothetical protein
LAKYSDDAKYVSAFNRSLKASNQAKLLLADLNKATPGTKKHTELKIRYDAAKATANAAEAERAARKNEIDSAEKREERAKESAKKKDSLKTELPQLEYQLQVAENKGDVAGIKKAKDAIKAARDKAAGIKSNTGTGATAGQTGTGAGTEAEAPVVSLTDFLKDAIGNPAKIKKLQQALKDAGTYKGPINGVFNAETLVPAAENAEEKLGIYAGLGIVFNDRFEGYKRLASGDDGTGGTGETPITEYPTIFSPTDAAKAINTAFESEVGREATAAEIKELRPLLIDAQKKNPIRYETKVVNGKKVVTQTTGLDVGTFLLNTIKKMPSVKAEIDQRLEGKQSLTLQALASTAKANGLDLAVFGDDIDTWVKRVDSGEDVDIFKNLIRKTAKIGLPDKVGALLDEGVDLSAVYSPYKNLMARVLEIDPGSIELDDPTLRSAIGPDKEMPIYEFERNLRKDARWQYTDTARKEVSDVALGVLRDFGFTG